jgi:hypothetical protein
MAELFNSAEIDAAIRELVSELAKRDIETDIYVVGGAAFLLRQIARRSTVDIDAKITAPEKVFEVSKQVAQNHGWNEGWFNNAARVFVPFDTDYAKWELYLETAQVRVHLAPFEDLLIMKLNAARERRDDEDLFFLIQHFGFTNLDEIAYFYESRCPGEALPGKAIKLVTKLLENITD